MNQYLTPHIEDPIGRTKLDHFDAWVLNSRTDEFRATGESIASTNTGQATLMTTEIELDSGDARETTSRGPTTVEPYSSSLKIDPLENIAGQRRPSGFRTPNSPSKCTAHVDETQKFRLGRILRRPQDNVRIEHGPCWPFG